MKNIHILPTDKPSRVYKDDFGKLFYSINIDQEQNHFKPQHIYITSDEEIKEGDWTLMFDDLGNLFLCDKPQQYLGIEKGHHLNKGLRKIILTTDQDLIKDGVQAIDDDFLEWFVKNPSCERVEIRKEMYMPQSNGKISDGKITHEISLNPLDNTLPYYKIIIPKEEPKQIKCYCGHTTYCDCSPLEEPKDVVLGYKTSLDAQMLDKIGPKQEKLEEAAESLFSDSNIQKRIFIKGAKWMQERMYSEEDMINFGFSTYCYISELMGVPFNLMSENRLNAEEWFEQFKNK